MRKINLPLLQQDYGDGGTIFEWRLFDKKLKPQFYYYIQIESNGINNK